MTTCYRSSLLLIVASTSFLHAQSAFGQRSIDSAYHVRPVEKALGQRSHKLAVAQPSPDDTAADAQPEGVERSTVRRPLDDTVERSTGRTAPDLDGRPDRIIRSDERRAPDDRGERSATRALPDAPVERSTERTEPASNDGPEGRQP